MIRHRSVGPLIVAGVVLGIGLDAFIDGIVLHEILQWHHMISNVVTPITLAGLQMNVRADGYFLLFAWLATVIGIALLWRARADAAVLGSTRIFVGSMLISASGFNVVDEVVNHLILNLHHIRPGPDYLVYDLGLTAVGIILFIGGWVLVQTGQQRLGRSVSAADQRHRTT